MSSAAELSGLNSNLGIKRKISYEHGKLENYFLVEHCHNRCLGPYGGSTSKHVQ
jgi:hypothetical protein